MASTVGGQPWAGPSKITRPAFAPDHQRERLAKTTAEIKGRQGVTDEYGKLQKWTQAVVLPASESISPETDSPISEYTEKRVAGVMEMEHESWELRTETVDHHGSAYDDQYLADVKEDHQRQITHYKNLLVRAQSASAVSIHDLHTKLQELQKQYDALWGEHQGCGSRRESISPNATMVTGDDLRRAMRSMNRYQRLEMLREVLEGCHPSDVQSQIAELERYKRSRFDIIGRLPSNIGVKVLSYLDHGDVLRMRQVSHDYASLTRMSSVWRSLCVEVDGNDGYVATLVEDDFSAREWEITYARLRARERHWRQGDCQSVTILDGHTNYVTSLVLKGDVLVSGSYDESIRIWQVPHLVQASQPTLTAVIPAKAVSCLDYYAPDKVLAAGYHDVGRVQVWRQGDNAHWTPVHMLNGHLNGIRAVAINEEYIITAGADKAIVVWDWRHGEKIVRFGQQTNVCVGIHLVHDLVISMTVDGILRAFSISQRRMAVQYKLSELLMAGDHALEMGQGMISWFQGSGGNLACGNKEGIYRLEWSDAEVDIPIRSREHLNPIITPTKDPRTPERSRTLSAAHFTSPPPSFSPSRARSSVRQETTPTKPRTPIRTLSSPAAPPATTPLLRKSIARKPSLPSLTPTKRPAIKAVATRRVVQPDVDRPPKIVTVIPVRDIERRYMDGSRRMIGATRFAARVGAERNIYAFSTDDERDTTRTTLDGLWSEYNHQGTSLKTPEKNPMSIVADAEKLIYGCSDGTIVIAGFV